MTTITTVIDPPLPTDTPAVFNTKAFEAWGDINTWATEANTVAGEVNTNATTATTQAGVATAQAGIATTQAGVAVTKAAEALASANSAAQSAEDALELVEKYLGEQATDPATGRGGAPLVDGNWYINSVSGFIRAYTVAGGWVAGVTAIAGVSALNGQTGGLSVKTLHGVSTLGTGDLITYTTTAVSKTLANMEHCTVTAATQTITLPATPSEGFECYVSVGAFDDTVLARNGQTVMGVAEDMTIDKNLVTVTARFTDGTWRIV